MQEVTYIITALTIIGTVANSFQKRWCFAVWMITNTFWIIYNLFIQQQAQALLYGVNLITSIIGFIKWRDKPKG